MEDQRKGSKNYNMMNQDTDSLFIIDAHLDLSMNAMEWNRDLRLETLKIRELEKGMEDKPDRGKGVVSFPALRKGNIGLVVGTQIARNWLPGQILTGWNSPSQAWAQTRGQLEWYREMEHQGQIRQISDLKGLEEHLKNAGLRALGPAHYGPGRYAYGTDASAHLGADGKALLKKMDELGLILDVTHLCDLAFWDAMTLYKGPIWASHNNCRALVNHNRQFDDQQIKALIERGAVIGAALDAWMMVPGWVRGESDPKKMNCSLATAADHIDHICQLAGNSNHIGIGSDLDGAFGKEQCPWDLEEISDLQKLHSILSGRGYAEEDIRQIFSENWLGFLRNAWK
jgi:membrane dipeptidase